MRTMLVVLLICVLLLVVVLLWMVGGVQRPRATRPPVTQLPGVPTSTSGRSTLTVVTWNIAWGYGWGSEGSGTPRPAAHFERSLDELGRVLATLEPDLVLLQEVDFDSARSHHVDQAEQLARAAGLPYVAKAISWQANYLPFPFWPPEHHFGAMRSGGAILSRYPLSEHRLETVTKPEGNPWWYNLGYLFRYHQEVTVEAPFGSMKVFNTHLEAFERENRVRHARLLAERIAGHMSPLTVVGGDFNTVLAEASQRRDYPDEPETSHVDDPTLELLRGVDGLVDTVAGPTYLKDEAAWFTFPAHDPNRKLDYLLTSAGFEVLSREVPRALAGELSDHLPLVVKIRPLE